MHSWITTRLGARNNNSGACGCREVIIQKALHLQRVLRAQGRFFMAARREQERVSFPWQIVARLGEIDATQSGSVPAAAVVERMALVFAK